jgi:ATP/maltotriose-dependent transcriptional regulator MalT
LFGATEALRETIGAQMGVAERTEYAQAVAGVKAQPAASTLAAAWAAGRTLSVEQAIAEAMEHSRLPAPTAVESSKASRVHQAVPPSSTTFVEPLSVRELEILHLIAAGHSNQAIADTLVIAVSTVKRHINNIYGKLGVQSRTQALARARELKLL